jgi:hypothetical protein
LIFNENGLVGVLFPNYTTFVSVEKKKKAPKFLFEKPIAFENQEQTRGNPIPALCELPGHTYEPCLESALQPIPSPIAKINSVAPRA